MENKNPKTDTPVCVEDAQLEQVAGGSGVRGTMICKACGTERSYNNDFPPCEKCGGTDYRIGHGGIHVFA